ncbi:hypothetical protein Pmar_PMAR019058 [Perkinsus marinus ATCC 50983]|uniref:Tubby C-terminal domain-containing protein n=1 Tax=Perkinsus marinus (strain ATCC 50983 / TXsc) TaxID=423536 RepID=C5KTR4_PERM5|nr:hypothetical protein Pmar_PMAR019058 [Perkinsus marinus ATCC 50983]EER11956.1 hypothetical protein Pmar_PMAR019058 [Perkinsus marinus ATCC 50983]|eukprot:XP_002780161.1 hypothetical protein Pmar_PMAR019058 [Perkinsus marinus ATCC 50983]
MLQRLLRYPSTLTVKSEDSATTTATGDSVSSETPSPSRQSPESLPFDIASYLEEGLAKESRWDLTAPLTEGIYRHLRVIKGSDDDFILETEDTNDFLAYCHVDMLGNDAPLGKLIRAKLYYYRPDDVLFKLDKPALVLVSSTDRTQWTVLSTRCDACRYRRKSSGTCMDVLSTSDILPRLSASLLDGNPVSKYRTATVGPLDMSSQQLASMVQDKRSLGPHGIYNFMEMVIPYGKDVIWCPLVNDKWSPLHPDKSNTSCLVVATKEPQWSYSMNCLVLDFNNRIIIPSAKNFQLVLKDSPETIVCQYGKIGNNTYTLDVAAPLSVMQAFAAAISTISWT